MNSLKLVQHINSLTDISDIMNAMKYLSIMESNKLSRYIQHQKRAMRSIELAADDFLHFHPELLSKSKPKSHIIVVIGSERGFCGNYNEVLYQKVQRNSEVENSNLQTTIITIGYKLHNKFEQHSQSHKALSGPRLVEEIPEIISELVASIDTKLDDQHEVQLTVLYHLESKPEPQFQKVLPAFQNFDSNQVTYKTPPLTYLSNTALFYSLVDEYLFAMLNQIFYSAFMSENQYRIRHMDNSLNKLTEKISGLSLKRNEYRQEEITEELEVIMLSANIIESDVEV